MKLLLVAKNAKLHINTFHLPAIKYLKENGWNVDVLTLHDADVPLCDRQIDAKFKGNPIHPATLKGILQVKKLINQNDYDVIYAHTPIGGVVSRLGAALSKKNPKVIYMAHGFHFYKGSPIVNKLIYYPIEKVLSYLTDVLITINKEDYYLAKNQFKAKDTKYIKGVGVDTNKFNPIEQDKKEEIRRQLNIPQNAKVIISVGELNKNKNHITVIKALGMLKEDILYIILGIGKNKEKLLKEAEKIDAKIRFEGYSDKVNLFLNAADLFVFPSIREGLPLSVMEAMASHLPIVASKIRGISDLVDEGKGGYLYDATDIKGFAQGMDKILREPNIASSMGEYNLLQVSEYSAEKITKQLADLIEDNL